MSRLRAILGSAAFFIVAPGTFAGLLPWQITKWVVRAPFFGFSGFRIVGLLLVATGLSALIESFARFALRGLGTPAPILPPRYLVVSGLYRYVRNPMYVALLNIVLGQALFFASPQLLAYAAICWLVTHLFVVIYEEPHLRKTFGDDYRAYCAAVPRWLPRLTPYRESPPASR